MTGWGTKGSGFRVATRMTGYLGAFSAVETLPGRVGWYTARAMTTDSDRISRLEGIVEQIAATLTALQQGQEALRTEMREGDAALRAEMREGDAALRAEMQNGDGALRAEMHNQIRMVLLVNAGIWGTVIAGIVVAVVVPILKA